MQPDVKPDAPRDYEHLIGLLPGFALMEISAVCLVIGIIFTYFLIKYGRKAGSKRNLLTELILSGSASAWLGVGTYIFVNASLEVTGKRDEL